MASASTATLYRDLDSQIQEGEFEEAIKTTDKILAQNPKDKDAIQTRCISLLNLDRFDECLRFIADKNQDDTLLFAKAYCLYRLNNNEEALSTIRGTKHDSQQLALSYLEAQILYKLGKYDDSVKIFESILKQNKITDPEFFANLSAAYTFTSQPSVGLAVAKKATEYTYELAYNAACALIETHDYKSARRELGVSKDLAQANLTEEEAAGELTSIRVQEAYVLQREGQEDKARAIYESVLANPSGDVATMSVAGNNYISVKKDQDVFDSFMRMQSILKQPNLHAKLTQRQLQIIHTNRSLLLMLLQKNDEARELARNLLKVNPDSDVPTIVNAAIYCKEKKFAKAESALKAFIQAHPANITNAKLILSQIQLNQNNTKGAIQTLTSLEDKVKYEPAIVGSIVSLHSKAKNAFEESIKILNESVNYWYNLNEQNPDDQLVNARLQTLLSETARFQLRANKFKEAGATFEKWVKLDPKNLEALAGYVSALSHYDVQKAETYAQKLPEVNTRQYDADKLERSSSTTATESNKRPAA
eukprot:GEZU01025553.1.p1 GENE.GEZU01025553.1~~GEZU01025553.1.p1  ORF type:complete len:547 (+),score=144.77 GEZU01025553.1:42-1643(+)